MKNLTRLILALLFILVGAICLSMPWSAEVRYAAIRIILEGKALLITLGSTFIIIGCAIIASISLNMFPKYYKIKCGDQTASVDEAIVEQYIAIFWKELFPNDEVKFQLTRKKGKINIIVELPFIPANEQLSFLNQIQKDLEELLATKIGYENDFQLNASFRSSQDPRP